MEGGISKAVTIGRFWKTLETLGNILRQKKYAKNLEPPQKRSWEYRVWEVKSSQLSVLPQSKKEINSFKIYLNLASLACVQALSGAQKSLLANLQPALYKLCKS